MVFPGSSGSNEDSTLGNKVPAATKREEKRPNCEEGGGGGGGGRGGEEEETACGGAQPLIFIAQKHRATTCSAANSSADSYEEPVDLNTMFGDVLEARTVWREASVSVYSVSFR
jgi:hypothetical protein